MNDYRREMGSTARFWWFRVERWPNAVLRRANSTTRSPGPIPVSSCVKNRWRKSGKSTKKSLRMKLSPFGPISTTLPKLSVFTLIGNFNLSRRISSKVIFDINHWLGMDGVVRKQMDTTANTVWDREPTTYCLDRFCQCGLKLRLLLVIPRLVRACRYHLNHELLFLNYYDSNEYFFRRLCACELTTWE